MSHCEIAARVSAKEQEGRGHRLRINRYIGLYGRGKQGQNINLFPTTSAVLGAEWRSSSEWRLQGVCQPNYTNIMKQVRNSICGFVFVESKTPCHSVPIEKRGQAFEQLSQKGNGFRFMFDGFTAVWTDREAHEAACAFIRKKILQIVTDPKKVKKLMPHDLYARRPLCDGGYYEQFNCDSVEIVDLKKRPIARIVPSGIETRDGTLHELDVLIFATGFDAIDGNYKRVRIRGRAGKRSKEHWEPAGPTSYLGVFVPCFPNLGLITGPEGPFSNILQPSNYMLS